MCRSNDRWNRLSRSGTASGKTGDYRQVDEDFGKKEWKDTDPMSVRDERGIALILALVLLALITMLGVWALDTSSTDLKIAGNYKNAETAFSMADTAVAYASNPDNLTTACLMIPACTNSTGSVISWSTPTISLSSTDTATVKVKYLLKGPLPAGSIYDADVDASGKPKFSGVYFTVSASGNGPNNAKAQIETNVVQVVSN
jgi:type IV pilus assembly protein PilX